MHIADGNLPRIRQALAEAHDAGRAGPQFGFPGPAVVQQPPEAGIRRSQDVGADGLLGVLDLPVGFEQQEDLLPVRCQLCPGDRFRGCCSSDSRSDREPYGTHRKRPEPYRPSRGPQEAGLTSAPSLVTTSEALAVLQAAKAWHG